MQADGATNDEIGAWLGKQVGMGEFSDDEPEISDAYYEYLRSMGYGDD